MTAVLREDFFGGAKGTTLAADMAAAATSLNVPAGDLATWGPVVAGRVPFVINKGMADEEKAYAANVVGDTLTGITRGQDGTIAADHFAGATITHGLFASHVDRPNEFLSSPTAAGQVPVSSGADNWGAPSSTLAGLTLTGAILTAPTIGDLTNMGHDHLDADDGGLLTQAATHQSPDTDTGTASLHHTIGTGANQAAPGTHPAATAAHGVTGAVVGTGGAQTLTGPKTLTAPVLTAPVIADFTAAQHDHLDADDGGLLTPAAIGVQALADAWTVYTPTLTATTTNPAMTFTAQQGRYLKLGKTVFGYIVLIVDVMTSAGTGTYLFSLPVAADGTAVAVNAPVGAALYFDASASGSYTGTAELFDSTHALIRIDGVGAGTNSIGATNPVAPATTDFYRIAFTYEVP